MIPQNTARVNTPIELDSLFDGDARLVDRAQRLAMTAAEMIRAAENHYHHEYMLDLVHQGGYNRVEVVMPYADPNGSPWVHLLPVGWRQTTSGSWMRTYLVRGKGPQYGGPDWHESENMREWLTADRDDHAGIMTETHP